MTVLFSHMGHDDRILPPFLNLIDRLATEHEASIMSMARRVHYILALREAHAMNRAAGGDIVVVSTEHLLGCEPAVTPVALDSVFFKNRDCTSSLCINREVLNKVAKARIARDANNALR